MNPEGRFEIPKEVTLESQWEQKGYVFHFGREHGLPSDIDIEVRVLDAEVAQGGIPERTVFVVGGAGEDLDVMKPFLLSMAKQGVQVVGVSMPSYGNSSDADKRWRVDEEGNDKVDFADYSTLIASVKDTLVGDEHPQTTRAANSSIDIIGHSMGGSIVADYATRYGDSINSVHLVAPAGRDEYMTLPGVRVPPELFINFTIAHLKERVSKLFQKDTPPVIKNLWINSFFKDGGLINKINDLEDNNLKPRMIQRFWEGMVAAQGKLDMQLSGLKKKGIPVTVYASENDALFPPEHYTPLSEKGIAVETLENMAHYGILDASDTFAQTIIEHMKKPD